MKKHLHLALLTAVIVVLGGCGGKKDALESKITIAVEGDVDSFNPLFAEEIVSGQINELIFPHLVLPDFDNERGELRYAPYLAHSWEFSNNNRDITFHLRSNARWSDGTPVTAKDVQYSFLLYGDTAIASIRQSIVQNFRTTNGVMDVTRAVEIINDSTVTIHFEKASPSQLFDVGVPLIPQHIYASVPKKELRTHPVNKAPVTAGPFALAAWLPMQEIVLVPSDALGEQFKARVDKLVFKILPEYSTRLAQVEAGEVDVIAGLRLEDAERMAKQPQLRVVSAIGRDYDFIGWNNVDPAAFGTSGGNTIVPHPLFGSARVRRALTMSINRAEIVQAYLGEHGREATGGVSPLFKWAYNDALAPVQFDKRTAGALLEQEGWKDANGDGVREKNGVPFRFTLKIASGNQLRDVIATVVQKQLRDVQIDMKIEQVERGAFWNDLIARKYDAWFAGFSVPLQMQLDDLWGSDLRRYPFNLAGYRNARIDQILAEVKTLARESDGAGLWKEFQAIVHADQPYTFMFWINSIVVVNSRVQNADIGILGTTHRAWEWSVPQ